MMIRLMSMAQMNIEDNDVIDVDNDDDNDDNDDDDDDDDDEILDVKSAHFL